MSKKDTKHYCRINHWVAQKDPKLADAIEQLCMGRWLAPTRRGGVTFLYPGKATSKKIADLAGGSRYREAEDLIKAHIVPDCRSSAADFAGGFPTKLGIKVAVKEAKSGKVVLESGAVLVVAEDFHEMQEKRLCVWLVESGEVPLEGPAVDSPSARGRYSKESKKPDGAVGGGSGSARCAIGCSVEADYLACALRDGCASRHPFLEASVSLLNYLQMEHPERLAAVVPRADRCPVTTFYLLVEPYRSRGPYMVPDAIIEKWGGITLTRKPRSEFQAFFDRPPVEGSDSAMAFANPKRVRSLVDAAREAVGATNHAQASPSELPGKIAQVYNELASSNKIQGEGPILPARTLQITGSGDYLRHQDELRFTIYEHFASLRNLRGRDLVSEFQDFAACMRSGTEFPVSNPPSLAQLRDPMKFKLLVRWVNSTAFLYVPSKSAMVGGSWGQIPLTVEGGDPGLDVYNQERLKATDLGRMPDSAEAPGGIDAAIKYYRGASSSN